jgi:Domain of unknown function (DUF4331)
VSVDRTRDHQRREPACPTTTARLTLKFPGDDARLDFTDLWVFPAASDPGKTVIVIDLNPFTTGMSAMPPFLMRSDFHPDGVRSDPFFADADGSFHGFKWTGQDAFADRNVLSIVMEVPHDMLSADPMIGLWASVSQRQRDGSLVQVDRGGHPTINPFVNPNNVKNTYNLGQPVDDVTKYLGPWSKFLEENGGYSPEAAEQAARIVLPDILRYDRSKPVGYPNGRAMTNDTFSARFAWMSDGKIPPQGLKPHDDLLSDFPYLGPPNVYPV